MALLAEQFGWECDLRRFTTREIEQFRAWRLPTAEIASRWMPVRGRFASW